jgi:hypothetical protein
MATYRTLLNRVLIALGHADDQVDASSTALTDAYHIKIAEWMNDLLEEIEDAAQWRVLRQRDTATIAANAISATLTNSNERSRIFRVQDADTGELLPMAFDVTDGTAQTRMQEMGLAELLFLDQQNSNLVTDGTNGPMYFALNQTATGMEVYVWPRTNTQRSLELDMIIPQSRLVYTTAPGLDTAVLVPNRPVVQGTIWWAMEDRGEEFGANGEKNEVRYRNMLSDIAAAENAAQGFDELVPT